METTLQGSLSSDGSLDLSPMSTDSQQSQPELIIREDEDLGQVSTDHSDVQSPLDSKMTNEQLTQMNNANNNDNNNTMIISDIKAISLMIHKPVSIGGESQ